MPNAYKLMCFGRNINGNRDVKFLECDYLLVQWCVKLTLMKNVTILKFIQINPAPVKCTFLNICEIGEY